MSKSGFLSDLNDAYELFLEMSDECMENVASNGLHFKKGYGLCNSPLRHKQCLEYGWQHPACGFLTNPASRLLSGDPYPPTNPVPITVPAPSPASASNTPNINSKVDARQTVTISARQPIGSTPTRSKKVARTKAPAVEQHQVHTAGTLSSPVVMGTSVIAASALAFWYFYKK